MHRSVAVRHGPLFGPRPHRLLEQRDRRHQVEDPPAAASHALGDAQGGERLARAASHDELAAGVLVEAPDHILHGGFLMRKRTERLRTPMEGFRVLPPQIRPIDGSVGKIVEPQHLTGRRQALNGLLCSRPPRVARIDDHAPRERLPCRRGDERVEGSLRDAGSRRMELALDRAAAAIALLGDQIHSGVLARQVRPASRPLGPQPDLGEPVGVQGVLTEVLLHEALKERPLFGLGTGDGPDLVKRLLEAAAHRCCRPNNAQSLRTLASDHIVADEKGGPRRAAFLLTKNRGNKSAPAPNSCTACLLGSKKSVVVQDLDAAAHPSRLSPALAVGGRLPISAPESPSAGFRRLAVPRACPAVQTPAVHLPLIPEQGLRLLP